MASTTRKPQIDDGQPPVHPAAVCITQETINRDLADLDILVESCASGGIDRKGRIRTSD
jgi:hypothetical protein